LLCSNVEAVEKSLQQVKKQSVEAVETCFHIKEARTAANRRAAEEGSSIETHWKEEIDMQLDEAAGTSSKSDDEAMQDVAEDDDADSNVSSEAISFAQRSENPAKQAPSITLILIGILSR
jgi:hypothetical protein